MRVEARQAREKGEGGGVCVFECLGLFVGLLWGLVVSEWFDKSLSTIFYCSFIMFPFTCTSFCDWY